MGEKNISAVHPTVVETMDHAAFLIIDTVEIGSRILMVQKKPRADKGKRKPKWGLPGGQRKFLDEFPLTTMHREMIEEIGTSLENPKEIMRILVENPSRHLFIVFAGYNAAVTIEKLRLGPEIQFAAFFDERQLKALIESNKVIARHAHAIKEYWRECCYGVF